MKCYVFINALRVPDSYVYGSDSLSLSYPINPFYPYIGSLSKGADKQVKKSAHMMGGTVIQGKFVRLVSKGKIVFKLG